MRGVGSQEDVPYSELFGAAVVDLIQVCLLNPVLVRLGMPGKHGIEVHWTSLEEFIVRQANNWVAVCHTPKAAITTTGDEAPMFGIDHVVPSVPPVLFEAIVEDLLLVSGLKARILGRKSFTFWTMNL